MRPTYVPGAGGGASSRLLRRHSSKVGAVCGNRSYGSVRGVAGDRYPYRDPSFCLFGTRAPQSPAAAPASSPRAPLSPEEWPPPASSPFSPEAKANFAQSQFRKPNRLNKNWVCFVISPDPSHPKHPPTRRHVQPPDAPSAANPATSPNPANPSDRISQYRPQIHPPPPRPRRPRRDTL